jgi:hypothetical protein
MSQTSIDWSQAYATWVAGDGLALSTFTINAATISPTSHDWANLVASYIAADYDLTHRGAALSVKGRASNSTGVIADIAAGTLGHVLHRTATPTVAFGTLLAGAFATAPGIVTPAMLDNGAVRSVLGRSANSSGARADIAGGGANQVLSDDGTTIAFRSITTVEDAASVLVDIDCSAQAVNDWNAGGDNTYSLGGFTWTIRNTNVADTFGPDGSTGVRYNASGTASEWTTSTRTATSLSIALTTLIPTWDVAGTYVVECYFSSVTLGTSGDRIQIAIDYDTAGTDRLLGGGRRNSSGTQQTYAIVDTTINGNAYTDDAIAIRVNMNGVGGMSGTYSAGFPANYQHSGGYGPAAASFASALDGSASLVISFVNGNTGGACDATLRRIRIRRIS